MYQCTPRNIETRDVLKAVLDDEIGLKVEKELISLVGVFEINGKMIYLTDPSVVPCPDRKVIRSGFPHEDEVLKIPP